MIDNYALQVTYPKQQPRIYGPMSKSFAHDVAEDLLRTNQGAVINVMRLECEATYGVCQQTR